MGGDKSLRCDRETCDGKLVWSDGSLFTYFGMRAATNDDSNCFRLVLDGSSGYRLEDRDCAIDFGVLCSYE